MAKPSKAKRKLKWAACMMLMIGIALIGLAAILYPPRKAR